jgi:hypothetical protein
MDVSDLGNIMFGAGGASRGYSQNFVTSAAFAFNVSQEGFSAALTRPDPRGSWVGWLLANEKVYLNEAVFCRMLGGELDVLDYRDAADEAANCQACEYKPPLSWHSEPSSLYYVEDWTRSGVKTTPEWLVQWLADFLP